MPTPLKGFVRGTTITLDAPVPPMEGKRVVVVLSLDDERDVSVGIEAQSDAWREWAEHGPQGPIDDEGAPEFP